MSGAAEEGWRDRQAVTLPHPLPITCPGAWCFICGDPYNDCTTPEQCGVVRTLPPTPEASNEESN